MTNKALYKEVRLQSKISFRKGMLAGHFLTRDIGRLCSVWFIKHNIVPNQITLFMILFGIVGSMLFAIPNIWCKIGGYLCWLMWFAMDCSDGQVARFTKTFSKYGTEMDYMAHLIDHPLMNLALWATFIEMNLFNPILVSFIFIISISGELILRNITAFDYYHSKLFKSNDDKNITPNWIKYLWCQNGYYPTLIVCYSWLIVIDYILKDGFSFWLYLVWLLMYFVGFFRVMIQNIFKFLKS